MLSILIPVYNYDITDLVLDLQQQCSSCEIDFEIRCYDDGSEFFFNEKNKNISSVENVTYVELKENIGRSKIRNSLAEDAKFEQLLFMDCDSSLPSKSFIKNYIKHAHPDQVIYGGRCYQLEPPSNKDFYLRWIYGIQRESTPYHKRQIEPYKSFMTNNFMVPKSIYLNIQLDETIQGYGHEDTLFGIELKKNKVPILHIDNPLRHDGLETANEFIDKTKEGIRNLYQLKKDRKISSGVKLLMTYKTIKSIGMVKKTLKEFKKRENAILDNLKSSQPKIRQFDLFKIGYLLEIIKEDD